jgi:hypothetical protein
MIFKQNEKRNTLIADYDSGEGSVKLSKEFENMDGLMKADILQDWIRALENEYEDALEEWHDDMAEIKVAKTMGLI